jgi:hypothetical protein
MKDDVRTNTNGTDVATTREDIDVINLIEYLDEIFAFSY